MNHEVPTAAVPLRAVGEFTLSGWSAETGVLGIASRRRNRRLTAAYVIFGGPSLVATVILTSLLWRSPDDWMPALTLGVLALIAQYFPVHVSYVNVSLGVGFLLAACLLVGPSAGAVIVAGVLLIWSMTRERLPWFGYAREATATVRIARAIYATGSGSLVYFVATSLAFAIFRLTPPVRYVTLETVGASIVLTVGVYLLQNAVSLLVSYVAGDDVRQYLKTAIPMPALAEFLALPAALLLAVTQVRLGGSAFSLLAWLYLMAAFLGFRSWQDRENLKARLDDLELLQRAGVALSGTLEMGELVRRFQDVVRDVVGYERLLLMIDDPGDNLSQVYVFDGEGSRSEVGTETLADTDGRPEGLFAEPDGGAVYARDLVVGEGARIRLRLDFPAKSEPSEADMNLFETICQQMGTAASNARLYRLANTDPLTGVAIRRYFERALRQLAARGERFAVIMLDIDWFKRVNDDHGHRAGDVVLRDLATILVGSLRVMDVAVRYGGEEFLILLPGGSSPEAAAVAERIRRALDRRRLTVEDQIIRYTASFGVASTEDVSGAADPMEVVWKADSALLEAKRSGRNQVVTFAALSRVGDGRRRTAKMSVPVQS